MTSVSSLLDRLGREIREEAYEEAENSVVLPINYADGSPIELDVGKENRISDGGRTLLRLLGDGRYDDLGRWKDAPGFFRMHAIQREGTEFVFNDVKDASLLAFLDGLRDLEFVMPTARLAGEDFDNVVRAGVRDTLLTWVKKEMLSKEDYETITHPQLEVEVPVEESGETATVPLRVDCDFSARNSSTYYVILANAKKEPGFVRNYIEHRLASAGMARLARPELHFQTLIPEHGYNLPDRAMIQVYAGSEPRPFAPSDASFKAIAKELIRNPSRKQGNMRLQS